MEFLTTQDHRFNVGLLDIVIPAGSDPNDVLNEAARLNEVARGLWSAKSGLSNATALARESVETAGLHMLEMAQAMIAAAHDAHFSAVESAKG